MRIAQRLECLEAKLGEKRAWLTVFQLEDGSTFTTEYDPITYLLKYGVDTPRGRIVHYDPVDDISTYDPLSLALVGYIHEMIKKQVQVICHDE